MDSQPDRDNSSERQIRTLLIVIGVLLSVVAGLASLLVFRHDGPDPIEVQAPPTPVAQRWFQWEGNGPITGEHFASAEECEANRSQLIALAKQRAEEEIRKLPPMTLREMEAMGFPAERIREGLARIDRIYCRRADY